MDAESQERSVVDRLIQASSDLALLLTEDGMIQEVHLGRAFARERTDAWLGRRWSDTVTLPTRDKVVNLLDEAKSTGTSRFRQVNQVFADGAEIPVSFTVVRHDRDGFLLALGRDLRTLSQLQQQLVDVQQALERDYWRLRQVETRYRTLFQESSQAVLLISAATRRVADANDAAGRALGIPLRDVLGARLPDELPIDTAEAEEVRRLLEAVSEGARVEPLTVHLKDQEPCLLDASLIREDGENVLLVHLRPDSAVEPGLTDRDRANLLLLDRVPDAWIVTDHETRILSANRTFLELAQLSREEDAIGESLSRWLGRPGADVTVLLASLEKFGVVRLFPTTLQGELDMETEVELSGTITSELESPRIGLVLRNIGRRLTSSTASAEANRDLGRFLDELTFRVGRAPLKELIQDTVGKVEAHFIEAALEMTDGNRTAAAELLGVSRQSLYTKLNRYNLEGPTGGLETS